MVPVRLQLANFLSYGEQVPALDFAGLRCACLSGANGHGKSSLLDAVTWALWGEARRPAAQLLRLGTTEMFVDLVFDHEDQRFRAHRRYSVKGGQRLDLFGLDPDGAWQTLSLGTLTRTQARLKSLLRMDYDTFVNSAFLLQGQADAFTRQTPAKRKEVLGEVLGLSRYDRLQALAKSERQTLAGQVTAAEAELDRLDGELATTAGAGDELAAAEAERERWSANREARQADLDRLLAVERTADEQDRRRDELVRRIDELGRRLAADRLERDSLAGAVEEQLARLAERPTCEAQAARLAEVTGRLAELDARRQRAATAARDLEQLKGRIAVAETEHAAARRARREQVDREEARRRSAEPLLARREKIRQAHEAYFAARDELAGVEDRERRAATLRERLEAVSERLGRERSRLEAEARSAEHLANNERAQAAAGEALASELAEAEAALAEAERADAEQRAVTESLADRRAEFERQKQLKERAEADLEELDEHLRLLEAGGGTCPVCRSELSGETLDEVLAGYRDRRQALLDSTVEIKQAGRANREARAELERRLESAKAAAAGLKAAGARVAALREQLAAARRAAVLAAEHEARAAALTETLRTEAFRPEDQAAAAAIAADLAALGYDAELHRRLRAALDAQRDVPRELERLEAAERDAAEVDARLPELRAALAALESADPAADLRPRLAELEATLAELADPADERAALSAERERLADAPLVLERLARDAERLPAEQERLQRLHRTLADTATSHEAAAAELAGLAEPVDRAALQADRARADAELAAAREALDGLQRRCGELAATLRRHEQQTAERAATAAEAARLRRALAVAGEVETAFGRDGIPALIIANAVPEIEQQANDLLGRLTGYRMHLTIRLQRPLQGGGERETLDLDIADELGTRAYENYSGGEAFRINFALRLALSRLLANRAGARLRTLIIDEGFGTQDAEGLDELVEALAVIGPEFDLILVVTHLESLKDRFPSRIEVSKEPEAGSSFTLVGADAA